jgi:hypothetical protein
MAFLWAEKETASRAGRTIEVRRQKYKNHTTGGGGGGDTAFVTYGRCMAVFGLAGFSCAPKVRITLKTIKIQWITMPGGWGGGGGGTKHTDVSDRTHCNEN